MKQVSPAQRSVALFHRKDAARWLKSARQSPDNPIFMAFYREARKYYEGFVFALYLADCLNYKSLKAFERELKKPIA